MGAPPPNQGARGILPGVAELLHVLFLAFAAAAFAGVPLYAWHQRGRSYAIFAAVILGFSLPGAIASEMLIAPRVPEPVRWWVAAFFAYSVAAAGLHLAHLVRARLRSPAYRWLVSVPGWAPNARLPLPGK